MTEFWVSQKMHWCEYCKCWLKASALRLAGAIAASSCSTRSSCARHDASASRARLDTLWHVAGRDGALQTDARAVPCPQDTPQSRSHHEAGLRHQQAVANRLAATKRSAAQEKLEHDMALKSMKDIECKAKEQYEARAAPGRCASAWS